MSVLLFLKIIVFYFIIIINISIIIFVTVAVGVDTDLSTEASTCRTALVTPQHCTMIVTEHAEWNAYGRTQPLMLC